MAGKSKQCNTVGDNVLGDHYQSTTVKMDSTDNHNTNVGLQSAIVPNASQQEM